MRLIRRRTDNDPGPARPAPPPEPPPRTAEGISGGRRGADASMWGLARRKLRDLRGKRWETATNYQREQEAKRQAREELARRIERQTGWRPSDRTLRRHVAAGTAPRGVDAGKLERQAAIDNAGSIAAFARMRGISEYSVKRWRDQGGDLPEHLPDSLRFHVAMVATLYSKGQRYKSDEVWSTEISVDGNSVVRVAEAARTGDYVGVHDLVGQLAAEQFPWVGSADRTFEVTDVLEISVVK